MSMKGRRRFFVPLIWLVASAIYSTANASDPGDIIVSDTASLQAALAQSIAGQRILLRAGSYEVSETLRVPDGVTVLGESIMQFDQFGLPIGIGLAGRTAIKATVGLIGDIVTLANGSSVRSLVIEDFQGRVGNAVVVLSRKPADAVAATIDQCEIINPNTSGIGLNGPLGRGIVVVTRNLNRGLDPPPHDESALSLHLTQSVVRSPAGGSGLFAVNFSSRSQITLHIGGSVLGGGLDAAGGVSRPDSVTGSSTTIQSLNNLYRSDSLVPTETCWLLHGGADAPIPGIVVGATTANRLTMTSVGDRIEGFRFGVVAEAARRSSAAAAPISMNNLTLNANGLVLVTTFADLNLFGARSGDTGIPTGDGNVLRLTLGGAVGSGPRTNRYVQGLNLLGVENRLEVSGNPIAFERTNQDIVPPPEARFFTSGQ